MFAYESTRSLSPAQRLDRAVTQVMQHDRYVAMAGVMMIGKLEIRDDVQTAATNGRDVYFNPALIEQLSDAQLRGVVIHETYHKLFRHLSHFEWMWNEDKQCANYAWDYRINAQIITENKADGFATLPEWVLYDTKYNGMDEAQIYLDLRKDKQNGGGGGKGKPGTGGQKQLDDHDVDGMNDMSPEEQQQLDRDIEEALRQGQMAAEKSGKGRNQLFDELIAVRINWDDVMRDFLMTTCQGSDDATWRQLNRRAMTMGQLRPRRFSESVDSLVVAIDTSGSIGRDELTEFLSILSNMLVSVNVDKIHVLYWDTAVRSHEVYGEHDIPRDMLVQSTKPVGGGGTTVGCVSRYMKEQRIDAQAVIVLTDGYIGNDWGTWPMPVLWGITSDGKHSTPPVGTTLKINL